jgi:two-component system sensor histidine kinase ChvG
MKRFGRFRGPRLSTKIFLLGLLLLSVPWFSYRQLLEMEQLLIQAQSNAQLLTAEGISTLFNGRDDLFEALPIASESFQSLYLHPLADAVRLDGSANDWGEALESASLAFGAGGGTGDGEFTVLLGERGNQLYAFVDITDNTRVYRSTDRLRLDTSDHVRLSYAKPDGSEGRVAIVFEEPGPITAFQMNDDWRFATTGTPAAAVQGAVVRTPAGLRLEFRLPFDMIGATRRFSLAYADVDDRASRRVDQMTQTLPAAGKKGFNLVALRSPEMLSIIQGLGYAGARVLVIDADMRLRAETGSYAEPTRVAATDATQNGWLTNWTQRLRTWLHQDPRLGPPGADPSADSLAAATIAGALQGEPGTMRRSLPDGQDVIMATHPVVSRDRIIGTVVVEQNTGAILAFQRDALEQVMWVSFVSFAGVLIALLAFAARLAWRIRNLRRDANGAIDQHGRLRSASLKHELRAGDELGDLARSVSSMLTRLKQHNVFLENMPRTLRHEINNPLNVLSTSLQNLASEHPALADSKYLESARRGVMRIGAIVQNLADAANLEDALRSEELERVDLNDLLQNYVANCARTHSTTAFRFSGPGHPVYAMVSDFRIEQLLDKIIDNAIDFHRAGTPVTVHLARHRDFLQISVANRGPILTAEAGKSLFDSMVSHRGPETRLHFGLGLYVVRIIAEHHGGYVRAVNLPDQSGVAILVQLPLCASDATVGEHHSPALA